MPKPSMNPKTPLGKRSEQMLGQETMRCDLHWKDKRVVLEYASSQEHLNPSAAAQDARRANVLGYKQLELLTVTPQMIAYPAEFNALVKQLAKMIGKRPAPNAFVFSETRRALRKRLFPWLDKPFGL